MAFERLNKLPLAGLLREAESLRRYDPNITFISERIPLFMRVQLLTYHLTPEQLELEKKSFDITKIDVGGLFYERFKWVCGGMKAEVNALRSYLRLIGINDKFLYDKAVILSFYEYAYYNNMKPIDKRFWYDEKVVTAPTEIYNIPKDNWDHITPYPITKRQFMKIITRDYNSFPRFSRRRDILAFQPVEVLRVLRDHFLAENKEMADNWRLIKYNIADVDLDGKCFLVNYLSEVLGSEFIKVAGFLANYHDPENIRRRRLEQYFAKPDATTDIFRCPKSEASTFKRVNYDNILSYPPFIFEYALLYNRVTPETYKLESILELVVMLIEKTVTDPAFFNNEIYYDPERVITELELEQEAQDDILVVGQSVVEVNSTELGNMIVNKEPILKRYPRKLITELAGYAKIAEYFDTSSNNFTIIRRITSDINTTKFNLTTRFDICELSYDYFNGEDYADIGVAVTYGTYFTRKCASLRDYIISFTPRGEEGAAPAVDLLADEPDRMEVDQPARARVVVAPPNERIIFRRPFAPGVFTDTEVRQLSNVLHQQCDNIGPTFRDDREELSALIATGLLKGITLQNTEKIIRVYMDRVVEGDEVAKKDLKHFKRFLEHAFDAGMRQRNWDGPGHPYPHLLSQTNVWKYDPVEQLSPQDKINMYMSPELSGMMEELRGMSPEFREQVENFPSIMNIRNDNFSTFHVMLPELARKLLGIERDEEDQSYIKSSDAQNCVAAYSPFLILTAYTYLKTLGYAIPGFDILRFESSTTHREQHM